MQWHSRLRKRLARGFEGVHSQWVYLVQVSLDTHFVIVRESDKFDAHPDSWVAGAHHGRRRELLAVDPEVDAQGRSECKWKDRLDITPVAADVGSIHPHWRRHPLIPDFKRKRHA